jgi:hypothetical protein
LRRSLALAVALLCATARFLPAQTRSTEFEESAAARLAAKPVGGPITIDGRLTEAAWAEIPAWFLFRQRAPDEGAMPTESTEVRVGYDADALYVGIRCFDDQPSRISRQLSRRDGTSAADSVAVYLDPRHDHLTGAVFTVSAAGVQSDAIIYNDFQTDDTWDAVWGSAVTIDDHGWVAEFRIPFSQLRFSLSGASQWGINVRRFIYRKNEDLWLQLVPRVEDRVLASRFAHLTGVEAIRPHQHFELLPYAATTSQAFRSTAGDPFNDGFRQIGSMGLDLKWGPTNAVTLDATFNPDFGQVELDPSVINLTEFETSFDEKRPFFLEGASLFGNFGRIGSGVSTSSHDLFYSRRIGRAPQGEAEGDYVDAPTATTILGAGKLTGKLANGWSFGALEAMTADEDARVSNAGTTSRQRVEPAASYFVGRVAKEGERGGVGIILTRVDRQQGGPSQPLDIAGHAVVAGSDGYRFLGARRRWFVSGQAAFSRVSGSPTAIELEQLSSRRYFQRPDVSYVRLNPEDTSLAGWNLGTSIGARSGAIRPRFGVFATSPGFEINDLGFQTRADLFGFTTGIDWLNYTVGPFTRSRKFSVTKTTSWNLGGQSQQDSWSASASLVFPSYWYTNLSYALNLPTFDDHLTRGGPLALKPRSQSSSFAIGTDGRRRVWLGGGGTYAFDAEGGWNSTGYISLRADPTTRLRLTTGPYVYRSRNVAQYFTTVADRTATDTFGRRYVFAGLRQEQLSFVTRADMSLSPRMSLQIYAEPFTGSGRYGGFKEFLRPRAFSFLQYGIDTGTVSNPRADGSRTVDPDGPGPATAFQLYDGDYSWTTMQVKSVFRWEWRPGSTLFVAWTQKRAFAELSGPPNNVLQIKMTWWASPNLFAASPPSRNAQDERSPGTVLGPP